MTLLAKLARRGPTDLLMAAEAILLMAFFRVCLAVIPVRRIIRAVTHDNAKVKPNEDAAGRVGLDPSQRELQIARRVQWAVIGAARHSFVEFVCFPQTLAAYTMLRWRGVRGTIVYGVARSPSGDLLGHTWLEAGDGIVTGGEESIGFAAVERWT